MRSAAFLLGRLMFGGFFLYNGINHIRQFKALKGYAASKKVPSPELAVAASGAMLIAGGTSLILGTKPKLGVLAIAGFLAATSPMMHDFWNDEDQQQKQNNMVNFTKNLALLGGAVALLGVDEPWPTSVHVGEPASPWRRLASTGSRLASTAKRQLAA